MPSTTVLADSTDSQGRRAPGLDCTFRDGGFDAAWVRVEGELDLATAPLLEQTLRRAEIRPRVVLDLRRLAFIDCRGVSAIIRASTRAIQAGRRMVIVRGPAEVDRVLALAGPPDALEVVDLDPLEPPVQALVKLARPWPDGPHER